MPLVSRPTEAEWNDWRWHLSHGEAALAAVLARLGPAVDLAALRRYPPRATPYYLSLARSLRLDDPILRQCLPTPEELAGGEPDGLAEGRVSPQPRLVHRYPDRALLVLTSACPLRCRHCMRKRLWQEADSCISEAEVDQALDYFARTPGLREVILSGGDPLVLDEEFLERLLARILAVPNIEMVRIGSRLPVVLPQRLTPEFCRRLGRKPPVWLLTHFNHPWELTDAAAAGIDNLLRAGIPVLNQTVLLKGVNDEAETLRQLFTGLLKIRVKPYYLFHGDPIEGTVHFRTGVDAGLRLLDQLRGRVSGLALPHYAIDLPDAGGKIRLEPDCACGRLPDGTPAYRSWDGREIPYPV